VEEIRRFGATARRVFLKKPPSKLQESFAHVVEMNRDERKAPARPWKRIGEEGYGQDYGQGAQDQRAKRQQGVGASTKGRGWDDHEGRGQDNRLGRHPEDRRGNAGQGLEGHH
jgi:hypothetical protein